MSGKDTEMEKLPVAIIGAGPVGLAAAAHLAEHKLPFVVLESGDEAGAAIREWGHVRIFSPWRFNIDKAAGRLLANSDWQAPPDDELPTGHEIVDRYIAPLSEHDAIKPNLRLRTLVTSIGRKDFDKIKTKGRETQPFEISMSDGSSLDARAVIDASGTWRSPNPIGSGGIPTQGEERFSGQISFGIPDVLGRAKSRYKGKRVLVVGSGHSAMNVVLDLLVLQKSDQTTRVSWAMRREDLATVFGGEDADALPARGFLGTQARKAVASKRLELLTPFRIREISRDNGALKVAGLLGGHPFSVPAEEIIVATGFRPQLDMLREIRLGLDHWLEAPEALAPLIDPNEHSCGTVRPHGAKELAHPEKDFFVIGMKSYGRAPTFLMATGYEQARSVAAWLAGDMEAAARIELELPETGVCSAPTDSDGSTSCCGNNEMMEVDMTNGATINDSNTAEQSQSDAKKDDAGCCGGPAPAGADACCVKDADAKAAGEAGCGCASDPQQCSGP